MSILDRIERAGNALPDPTTLFVIGAIAVMLLSHIAVMVDWEVKKTVMQEGVQVHESLHAKSLLTSDGLYWAVKSMVDNFKDFPPLAIVLVGMLGIGIADRSGLIAAFLKGVLLAVPPNLLTPTVFFLGVLSSLALDAGYVVLPPIAAALYAAVGRSPLVGLAAVFAGVSAGFSANLMVTSLDAILAGFSQAGAQILDPDYEVAPTANLYFIIVSTFLLTAVGWAVTAFWVEPRLQHKTQQEGGPATNNIQHENHALDENERRGLRHAGIATLAVLALFILGSWIPGAPFHGAEGRFPRWVIAIIPLIFIGFLVPGLAYGFSTKRLTNDRDIAKMMGETLSDMGPYIVLAFFAAQFVAYFNHSGLGEMLAITGGNALASAELPTTVLVLAFVGIVMLGNLLIGSMSAKYAFFAPVFVPMFMAVGISPELTQAAYRVGDSVTNVITPLNPYMVILLVYLQQWVPKGGIGTLIALMVPYALAFALAWSALLTGWISLGIPLGQGGPLTYSP